MARNDLQKLAENLDRLATAAFSRGPARAAEQVVADLQKAGPQWTGRFANSWVITSGSRQTEGSGNAGAAVRLSAPLLTGREFLFKPEIKYTIFNKAPYADYAQDIKEGYFYPPAEAPNPIGTNITYGNRVNPSRRGELSGAGGGRSTAPLDWFATYVNGGKFEKTVQVAWLGELPKTL